MPVFLHGLFLDSLAELDRSDQRHVREMLHSMMANPKAPGLRAHNVGGFRSLSASMALRALAAVDGETVTLIHVARHDDAIDGRNDIEPSTARMAQLPV